MLERCFVVLLLFVGTYLTVYTRFFPLRNIRKAFKSVFSARKRGAKKITAFSSLCTTLAATIGTGNIVGVASAVTVGGPGALFWMEVGSLVSMAIKYAENVLAVRYRQRDYNGKVLGGPFTYMEQGLGEKYVWLSKAFCLACLIAGILGMGTIIQSGSIAGALDIICPNGRSVNIIGNQTSVVAIFSAAIVTLFAGLVIFGGVSRIASVSEKIVPVMAVGYVLCCSIILLRNYDLIPETLAMVVQCAFTPKAASGAFTGITTREMIYLGIQRGIFSNEAGLGTSAIAAGSSEESDEITQGYAGMVSVFIDTMVLCTLTGLTVIITGATGSNGVETANASWELGLPWQPAISRSVLCGFLIIFGFTSILGWNFFVERCLTYLFNSSKITQLYQGIYLLAVFLGPFLSESFAWKIADITNAFMAIPNLITLFLLRRDVYDTLPMQQQGKEYCAHK